MVSYRKEKPSKPQNRPKIPPRHPNSPTAGDCKNTPKIPEKYSQNTSFVLFECLGSGKSKWGLSKWGLKALVHNCPRLPTIVVTLRRKLPLERGPKRPQKCTIVDDCAQIVESGLKPPFESPHLDFNPKIRISYFLSVWEGI